MLRCLQSFLTVSFTAICFIIQNNNNSLEFCKRANKRVTQKYTFWKPPSIFWEPLQKHHNQQVDKRPKHIKEIVVPWMENLCRIGLSRDQCFSDAEKKDDDVFAKKDDDVFATLEIEL